MNATTPNYHAQLMMDKLKKIVPAKLVKKSAILFCDEMIDSLKSLIDNNGGKPMQQMLIPLHKHWKDVKTEIQKLA